MEHFLDVSQINRTCKRRQLRRCLWTIAAVICAIFAGIGLGMAVATSPLHALWLLASGIIIGWSFHRLTSPVL